MKKITQTMSGSSKHLLRDLNALFQSWEHTQVETGDIHTSQLFRSITAFIEKHNTLHSINLSTNLHNKLYEFYNQHIRPKNDLPRERVFVEILTQLLSVLSQDEIEIWLFTYLKPAVDSANFDSKFVVKCRDLILKICDFEMTQDDDLNQRQIQICTMTVKYLLDLYLNPMNLLDHIGINLENEDRNSQEFSERLRFIKSNCSALICDVALLHPTTFGDIVNEYFLDAKLRLGILTLLGIILNSKSSKLHALTNTKLFGNFFKCLLCDFDERIIAAGLSVLVMLVPLVSDKISNYLPDLLIIYSRIIMWYNYPISVTERASMLSASLESKNQSWEIAMPDSNEYKKILDAGYLVTIIYGLFPCSLTKYSQSPLDFFKQSPANFVDSSHLVTIHEHLDKDPLPVQLSLIANIKSVTTSYLKSFRLHPNFLKPERFSTEYETKRPTQWLIEDNEGDSLGVEEIMIGCLSLNPFYGFFIPDDIDSDYDISSMKGSRFTSTTKLDSNPMSRSSSMGSPLYFGSNNGAIPNLLLANFTRKLSVIPTNLTIDNNKKLEISFKDVTYERMARADSVDLPKAERKGSDPLQELFSTHEQLYSSKSLETVETYSPFKAVDVHSLLGDKGHSLKPQSSIASVDSSKDMVVSSGGSLHRLADPESKRVSTSGGTIIDFYHRELLLMKNEFEFASYIKHLSKFQYIKLKLQMNRLVKETEALKQTLNVGQTYKDLLTEYNVTKNALNELKDGIDNETRTVKQERELLTQKLVTLQEQNDQLLKEVDSLKAKNQELIDQLEHLSKVIIPSKDEVIFTAHNKIKDLTTERTVLENEINHLNLHEEPRKPIESIELSDSEKQVYDLKIEIDQLTNTNYQLSNELQQLQSKLTNSDKHHNAKYAANKKETAYQVNTLSNQYEKKIQELTNTILKYETLVEEKNVRIAQLSASRPISIPGSNSFSEEKSHQSHNNQPTPMDIYEFNRNNLSSSNESMSVNSQLPLNTPPLHTPVQMNRNGYFSSQNAPIIKGRGGYQKRSKKHM